MNRDDAAQIILLGTAGGSITWAPGPAGAAARYGISTAIAIGGKIYVVDQGLGSARQLTLADPFSRGAGDVMTDLAAFFITHLHSDHVVDLGAFLHCGRNQGWPTTPVPVVGPGSRTLPELPVRTPGYQGGDVVPGTLALVDHLTEAFAADTADRVIGSRKLRLRDLLDPIEVVTPEGDAVVVVFEDDRVRVSATHVSHGSMEPALAYRFDTEYGAVTLSGDTGPSENLIRLARGSDLLVHEAISHRYAEWLHGPGPYSEEEREELTYIFAKHTSSMAVGEIANRAAVSTLVLSHLVPGNAPDSEWARASEGFDGEFVIGRDLMRIQLRRS